MSALGRKALPWIAAWLAAGCTTVGKIDNLDDAVCRHTFTEAMSSILVSQKENPDVASRLAGRSPPAHMGPRPFLVSSPSGADYEFFVEVTGTECVLRLYGRQKGFWTYTNNLTYIDTKPLAPCLCSE
jgi:hypothetical protein